MPIVTNSYQFSSMFNTKTTKVVNGWDPQQPQTLLPFFTLTAQMKWTNQNLCPISLTLFAPAYLIISTNQEVRHIVPP